MSLEQLKSIYDLVLSEIHRHVHERFLFEETERATAFDTFHTLGELRHYLKSYATDTKQLISEQANLGETVITVAESIVREHYSRDLQLAEVANRVSMNYSYFSKLFKERTGLTFTAYLTKVRMEEAQKLLKNPPYGSMRSQKRLGMAISITSRVHSKTISAFPQRNIGKRCNVRFALLQAGQLLGINWISYIYFRGKLAFDDFNWILCI